MARKGDKNGLSAEDIMAIAVVCILLVVGLLWLIDKFQGPINAFYAKCKVIETYLYMFWDDSWRALAHDVMEDKRDLSGPGVFNALATFYNRYAAFVWLLIYFPFIWFASRKTTRDNFRISFNPQKLIETDSKMFTPVIPWVHRDMTKVSWNIGRWRLMESPIMFLVRNRAIKDKNGKLFRLNQTFKCGDCEKLYEPIDGVDTSEISDPEKISSYDVIMSLYKEDESEDKDRMPERQVGTEEDEIKKFEESSLIPDHESWYLNKNKKDSINQLDERRLRVVFAKQAGEIMLEENKEGDKVLTEDPFAWLKKKAEEEPKTKWLFGLAVAMYLHGFSDETKKDAYKILDGMNKSMGGSGEFVPENVNIGSAMTEKALEPKKWRGDIAFMKNVAIHAAYVNPFMMALLEYARTRGVLSTAYFGWIKAFDRTLWYALNQTGRTVASIEAVGALSHHAAEVAMGKALEEVYTDIAIEGVRQEMIREGWLNSNYETARKEEKRKKSQQDAGQQEMNKIAGLEPPQEEQMQRRKASFSMKSRRSVEEDSASMPEKKANRNRKRT